MTNSEKQTKTKSKGPAVEEAPAASAKVAAAEPPAYASRSFWNLVRLLFLLMGFGFSLQINHWHFTVPVAVLWFGWAGVLATVGLLWDAGMAFVSEASDEYFEELDIGEARRHELLAEKKSLILAIKEIEFDRDLGKMSEADASEMMKVYRSRAITTIKELDGQSDSSLSVRERVERDMRARLALVSPAKRAGKRVPRGSAVSGAKKNSVEQEVTKDLEESA